jgi:hypothetical protein
MEKEQIIKIAVPAGKKAEWVDGFLKLVDNEEAKEKKPVTERVKTFDDACKELGIDAEAIQQQWQDAGITMLDEVAYQKLRIITAALNEGWEPEFKEDEYRYYPYCILYTKAEIEQKDDEWKDEHNLQLWVGGGHSRNGSYCGLASAYSTDAWSNASAALSARLAHKTEELAIYSGKQFTELWANYYTGKEVQSWRNS